MEAKCGHIWPLSGVVVNKKGEELTLEVFGQTISVACWKGINIVTGAHELFD